MSFIFYIDYSREDLGRRVTRVVANNHQEAKRTLIKSLPRSLAILTIHDVTISGPVA